jgi:hypothetical protein
MDGPWQWLKFDGEQGNPEEGQVDINSMPPL